MSQSAVAPAPAPGASAETAGCPSCGSTQPWGFASWCPSCGFYPKLNTRIATPEVEVNDRSQQPTGVMDMLPPWLWLMGGGILGVVALSVWARLTIAPHSAARLIWAISQILAGTVVATIAHAVSYFVAITKTDKIGPFDIFLSPLSIWRPTFAQLPKGSSRLCLVVWGMFAILAALVVVDGIPWMALFEGKSAKKVDASLLQSVVREARKERKQTGDGSLEEAMNQFVGEAEDGAGQAGGAGGDEVDEEAKKAAAEAEKEKAKKAAMDKADCVIFGYHPEGKDDFSLLLLATVVKGKLSFVCTLTGVEIPEEERREMVKKFKTISRDRPFVKTALGASWVQPVLMVRVRHDGWTRDKKMKQAEFVENLEDVKNEK